MVPRLSYASVEEAFLELAAASPVRSAAESLGRHVTSTLEGLKARPFPHPTEGPLEATEGPLGSDSGAAHVGAVGYHPTEGPLEVAEGPPGRDSGAAHVGAAGYHPTEGLQHGTSL